MEDSFKLLIQGYKQTIKGGCGPSCLLMCLHYFRKETLLSVQLEKNIWNDSTFGITSSVCNLGLALVADKLGLKTEILQEFKVPKCFNSSSLDDKTSKLKERFLEFERRIKEKNIPIIYGSFGVDLIKKNVHKGDPIIVLIKSEKSYHFILVIGYTKEDVIYINPTSGEETRCSYKKFEDRLSIPDGKTAIIIKNG